MQKYNNSKEKEIDDEEDQTRKEKERNRDPKFEEGSSLPDSQLLRTAEDAGNTKNGLDWPPMMIQPTQTAFESRHRSERMPEVRNRHPFAIAHQPS